MEFFAQIPPPTLRNEHGCVLQFMSRTLNHTVDEYRSPYYRQWEKYVFLCKMNTLSKERSPFLSMKILFRFISSYGIRLIFQIYDNCCIAEMVVRLFPCTANCSVCRFLILQEIKLKENGFQILLD